MKFIAKSSDLEVDFNELKDPVAFLDSIKKDDILIEEPRYKQEEFKRYLKKIRIGNKKHWLILICFLTEEMKLLNL